MTGGLNNKNNKLAVITIMTLTMDLDGENFVFPIIHLSDHTFCASGLIPPIVLDCAPANAP